MLQSSQASSGPLGFLLFLLRRLRRLLFGLLHLENSVGLGCGCSLLGSLVDFRRFLVTDVHNILSPTIKTHQSGLRLGSILSKISWSVPLWLLGRLSHAGFEGGRFSSRCVRVPAGRQKGVSRGLTYTHTTHSQHVLLHAPYWDGKNAVLSVSECWTSASAAPEMLLIPSPKCLGFSNGFTTVASHVQTQKAHNKTMLHKICIHGEGSTGINGDILLGGVLWSSTTNPAPNHEGRVRWNEGVFGDLGDSQHPVVLQP